MSSDLSRRKEQAMRMRKETSRLRNQPVQRPWGGHMQGLFKEEQKGQFG